MIYLVFKTEEAATTALNQINSNMHFPKPGVNAKTGREEKAKGVTTNWADAEERLDGCFCFPEPPEKMMKGVKGFKVEKFDPKWFPEPEIEDNPL